VASAAIAQILAAYPHVRLVLFENTLDISEFPELGPFRRQIEWRTIVPVSQLLDEYASLDINIAPLEVGNAFCEAKSELKYFEAALVGVPTIASPTRPFAESIKNGETGFLARCESEWRHHSERLIVDPDLRRQIARNAYADVLWTFGPERRNMLVTRLLNALVAPPPVATELARSAIAEVVSNAVNPLPMKVAIPEFDVMYKSVRGSSSRVSVIIPLFNYEAYVLEALESVKNQSLLEIDLIAVDDCSTDNSAEVASTWLKNNSDRFNMAALLKNHQNSKLARTRNAGIGFAQTEFVLPLDADNLLLPNCLERCIALLDETAAAMAYPTLELFGDDRRLMGVYEWDPTRLQFGNYIDAMTMLRKACWAAVGGYSPLDFGWEDYDLWCKFAEVGFWGVRVPQVTARYRVHGKSMLRTCTNLAVTKARVLADITARHPWLEPLEAAQT
jgi:hypothetical protein